MTAAQKIDVPDSSSPPVIDVGLLWHSATSGNLGVGALTLGNIALAQGVAQDLGLEPRFTVIQMRDGDTAPITPPSVRTFAIDSRSMVDPRGFLATVGTLDCVLDIGAGDSFADIYGAKRFAFMWGSKIATMMRGVPLVLSPQTIGPFESQPYKAMAAFAMNRAAAVVARDDMSLSVARALAPKAHTMLSVDVAFVLPYVDRSAERGRPKLRIGVNASGLLFHQAETGRNRFGLSYDYAQMTRDLLSQLCARTDVEVHLVPHATSGSDPADDDGALADRLHAMFPQTIRVPNFPGPSEAKSYISSLDFLVAGRMHACIGAYSSGTPVVPVAYSRKFSGLFDMLGYDGVLPMTGLDEAGAIGFVVDGIDRRAALAQKIGCGMTQVQSRLDVYRDVLRDLFNAAAGKRAA